MPITVGIPFYNAEAYLADAVRSVLAQSYRHWELILLDDGSTDRSLEIAKSFKDPRIRVISDGQNKKLPCRLNQITAMARYDLVARMDADDMISPYKFEKQLAVLNSHPEIDLVSTGVCSITNYGRPVGIRCGSPDEPVTGRRLLMGKAPIVHASILGRKKWFLRNPYSLAFNGIEDHELWLRAFSKKDLNIYIMSEPLYYYREEENLTGRKILAAYSAQRRLYKKYRSKKKYAPLGMKLREFPLITARSYMKTVIVTLLSAAGKMDLLVKERNSGIHDKGQLKYFNWEIEQIRG